MKLEIEILTMHKLQYTLFFFLIKMQICNWHALRGGEEKEIEPPNYSSKLSPEGDFSK